MSQFKKNRLLNLIFSNLRIIFLLFLFLVVFGASSLISMQKEGFPDILVNVATVTVAYPNATAAQVEDQIVKPIEEVLLEIEGVKEFETVANDHLGLAIVTIDESADVKAVIAEIDAEITAIDFPEDARKPDVDEFSVTGLGQFIIGVAGPKDPWLLHQAAGEVQKKFEALPGVRSVKQINPLGPEVLITFDEEALNNHDLTRLQVEGIIKMAQFNAPVGTILDKNEKIINIVLDKDLSNVEDLKTLLLLDGVVLSDVATIETRLDNGDKYNRIGYRDFDNQFSQLYVDRAILLSVHTAKSADILEVDDILQELLLTERQVKDADYQLTVLYNQADETRLQVEEISASVFGSPLEALGPFGFIGYLFGGLGLVVLLLFVFMNARIAIMAAAAIPLSLFFAAIYLRFMDINLNTLVIFAMVLVIGLVVDPTIVFLESMQRFKSQGFSGRLAAERTFQTVGLGVFLAVVTNILVFVPFGVVGGFFGQIIKYIPMTVIPAMIASMLIPILFFVPLAAKILPAKKVEVDTKNPELTGTWWIAKKMKSVISFMLGKGKLKVGLRILIVLLAMALPVIVGYTAIKTGAMEVVQFSSEDDTFIMIVNADIEDSFTFEKAVYEIVVPLQDFLAKQPEILSFSYFEQRGNSFSMLVTLLPMEVREEEGLLKANDLADYINEEVKTLNLEAIIEASTTNAGPPAAANPVNIRLMDNDPILLAAATSDVSNFLNSLRGVTKVEDNTSSGKTGGSVTLQLEQNNLFAQNPAMVYAIMKSKLGESDLGSLTLNDQKYDILTASDHQVSSSAELYDLVVGIKPDGRELVEVTVADVVKSAVTAPSQSIRRFDGRRYVQINAQLNAEADVLEVQALIDQYLSEDKLKELGLAEDALLFKGEADLIADSFTDLFMALAIAIFMIYILLVAFLRSYIEPFIILFAIPLGLIGVIIAVVLTGGQLGFLELLGVVTMAGIVVNVTILLLDYANQLKRQGKSPAEAISIAVGVRFRPIALTQITAFGSLIPLVIISPFWKGLALAIILGIISSALLSLFVTPILYLWSNTLGRTLGRIKNIKVKKILRREVT